MRFEYGKARRVNVKKPQGVCSVFFSKQVCKSQLCMVAQVASSDADARALFRGRWAAGTTGHARRAAKVAAAPAPQRQVVWISSATAMHARIRYVGKSQSCMVAQVARVRPHPETPTAAAPSVLPPRRAVCSECFRGPRRIIYWRRRRTKQIGGARGVIHAYARI